MRDEGGERTICDQRRVGKEAVEKRGHSLSLGWGLAWSAGAGG